MRLYFPVDSTGNLIMIEKFVSGGIWTGDFPIFNPNFGKWSLLKMRLPTKPLEKE